MSAFSEIQSRLHSWSVLQKTALTILILLGLASLFAPWISPYPFDLQNIEARLLPPSAEHWLGTDFLGRDLLSRLLYGGRVSLTIGLCTAVFSLWVGTAVGACAGYWGGWVDRSLMFLVNFFYIFPSLLLAILFSLCLGRGLLGILAAISLTAWVNHARLVRGLVLQTKELPFVEAARAVGVAPGRILLRHILPQLWEPILISLAVQIPSNIMAESFLSFIGLGIQPPHSSWGTLASEGFRAMRSYPHLMIYPSLTLLITLLAFQFLLEAPSLRRNSRPTPNL